MPENSYKSYGLTKGYLPKIYFNKITLEDAYVPPKPDKSALQYIDEDYMVVDAAKWLGAGKAFGADDIYTSGDKFAKVKREWPAGFNPKKGNECTRVRVDASMLFLAADFEAFKQIFTDDDFFKGLNIVMGFGYGVKGEAPITELPDIGGAMGKTQGVNWYKTDVLLPDYVEDPLKSFLVSPKTITKVDVPTKAFSLYDAVGGTEIAGMEGSAPGSAIYEATNQTPGAGPKAKYEYLFNKHTKTLPNGFTYFELPLTIVHDISAKNLETVKVFAFTSIDEMDIDFSFNIANQDIKLDMKISELLAPGAKHGTTAGLGPLTMERVMENNKIQDVGILFTISQNQGSVGSSNTEGDLQRESMYNDRKGEPWLGPVHQHWTLATSSKKRYMGGAQHNTSEIQPYLDVTYVKSRKVTDIRSIKQLQNINVDLSSLEGLAKIGNVKYKNNKDELTFLNKKIYFSNLMLTATNNTGNYEGSKTINGFFGIDWINILHNNCLLPRLLEKIIHKHKSSEAGSYEEFVVKATTADIVNKLDKTLNIKIVRHGANNSDNIIPKIIFDSRGADFNKIYPKQSYGTFNPNDNSATAAATVHAPLGYLSQVDLTRSALLNKNRPINGAVDFFTFTDLDETKRNGIKYKYEIELTFDDPMLSVLGDIISLLKNAIDGAPGVASFAGLVGLKKLVYLMDYYSTKKNPNMSLMTVLNEVYAKKVWNKEKSVNPANGVLVTVENVLKSLTIPLLLDNTKTGQNITENFEHAIRTATSIKDPNITSLTNITMVLNLFESLYANLVNIYDAFSKVNHSKDQGPSYSVAKSGTKAAGSANPDRYKITVGKTFPESIHIDDVGLDYCQPFLNASPLFPVTTNSYELGSFQTTTLGNKTLTTTDFKEKMNKFLSEYYSKATVDQFENQNLDVTINMLKEPLEGQSNPSLESVGYSFLPLKMNGVRHSNLASEVSTFVGAGAPAPNWDSLISSLLLGLAGNKAQYSYTNLQSAGKNGWNTTLFEKETGAASGLSSFNIDQIRKIVAAEKNQQLLWQLGMSTQDKVETIYVAEDNQQAGNKLIDSAMGNMNNSVPTPKKITSTDIDKNYFMSYVANYAENNLNYVDSLFPLKGNYTAADTNIPAQTLSLMLKAQSAPPPGAPTDNVNLPATLSSTYDSKYNSFFGNWQYDGANVTTQLFVNRLMEYYFRFFHCVEIFYLKGFNTYNGQALSANPDPYSAMTGKTSDGAVNTNPTLDTLDSITRPALNSLVWEKLTWNTISMLQKDDQIFCKIDNYNNPYYNATIEQTLKNFLMLDKYFIIRGT